jgi:hypothetical protein
MFPLEVWRRFRPYGVHFVTDFLIFLSLWAFLWIAHSVGTNIPVEGPAALFLIGVHETLVVLNYLLLGMLALFDVWTLKKKEHEADHV